MASNYPIKFHFAVFTGFSQEFHGYFINLWFMVVSNILSMDNLRAKTRKLNKYLKNETRKQQSKHMYTVLSRLCNCMCPGSYCPSHL